MANCLDAVKPEAGGQARTAAEADEQCAATASGSLHSLSTLLVACWCFFFAAPTALKLIYPLWTWGVLGTFFEGSYCLGMIYLGCGQRV